MTQFEVESGQVVLGDVQNRLPGGKPILNERSKVAAESEFVQQLGQWDGRGGLSGRRGW